MGQSRLQSIALLIPDKGEAHHAVVKAMYIPPPILNRSLTILDITIM